MNVNSLYQLEDNFLSRYFISGVSAISWNVFQRQFSSRKIDEKIS
ncbi:MAG: hypothetical protein U9O65_08555 [Thermotogota bacterium]|nr:hypothetical protein [Thermotogota bacterium]